MNNSMTLKQNSWILFSTGIQLFLIVSGVYYNMAGSQFSPFGDGSIQREAQFVPLTLGFVFFLVISIINMILNYGKIINLSKVFIFLPLINWFILELILFLPLYKFVQLEYFDALMYYAPLSGSVCIYITVKIAYKHAVTASHRS